MGDWEERERSDSVIAGNILLISGLSGFILGAFCNGTWQLAVESVQVISHAVIYPEGNPFYWYHTKAWTLLHQLFVPCLWLGMSTKTISFLMSGLMGMLAFQAIALCVWAISKDALLSLGSPFLVVFTYATRYSSVYPVFLMSNSNTQGTIGLSLFLLTIALISSEKRKAGLFFLGLLPAVHLSIAALCWLIVFPCLCFGSREWLMEIRKESKFFLFGLCISLVSLFIHYQWVYDVPRIEGTLTRKYFEGFIRYWDSHRRPVQWSNPGVYLNCTTLVLSFIWSTKFRSYLNKGALFFLRCVTISSLFGLTFAALSQLPPESLPETFLMLMPFRILEFSNFVFVSLFLGLCGIFRKNVMAQVLLTLFIAFAIVQHQIPWKMMLAFSGMLFLLPVITDEKLRFFAKKYWPVALLRSTSITLLFYAAINLVALPDLFHSEPDEWRRYNLKNQNDDQFFESASHRAGLLLTASDLHLIQLRTKRPVLLDGGQLDMLPYAPETGPQMAKILKEVYGVDFFAPPRLALRTATIPLEPVKQVWESRSEKAWKLIRQKYGVTEVLTYSDWKLELPLISNSGNLSSYEIPN
jgi:hypothetical protein